MDTYGKELKIGDKVFVNFNGPLEIIGINKRADKIFYDVRQQLEPGLFIDAYVTGEQLIKESKDDKTE